MAATPGKGGARKKKGPLKGTGGHGRKSLEGRGPTPKAEDRAWHSAGKRKAARERIESKHGGQPGGRSAGRDGGAPRRRSDDETELVTGRNSVLEALRAGIPATALHIAARIEFDDRVKEILRVATSRGIPVLEVMRPELDRLAGRDAVHQGVLIRVPPYEYDDPMLLLDRVTQRRQTPLVVALDGVTDPRNLGAIIRSVAAFGGHGVVVPQRRSAGVTASAWKTSAGAVSRLPVAMAANLVATIKAYKAAGLFVIGLDGDGDMSLPGLDLATSPLLVVVGSEGKGLSRLVTEQCDAIVSIPIDRATESLNAGIAASVTLYEVAKLRAERLRNGDVSTSAAATSRGGE
ncbi:23S rRNA (guanosine(2251)-2'-O)-methyltransferase RlmB [Pseudoclavibacter endophyticus]|uniref:23S rRNA (Guanosine(2251)-2'-O)-methyltransferase RlmB n=1 Tax=Pseudoclavibacter endophyticus TaxID=1778590 RepID=A0A6H9WJN9_9MICO|nr:23S rRNA (guanosine(2251)-2'-O)-methyltransferase RlmB [Pseudoclavibacter endophyticus]KAB1649413.1 23S rRNA (guanosine(2251)-2'-O)-methyltransferase RlmB [Pseudoclavibacter endophyticus]GGA62840.1 23S rRNA (guanosine(2251)-2'-O)-methyltransferase RlmB [Pseudoclavibacter endophyticus]